MQVGFDSKQSALAACLFVSQVKLVKLGTKAVLISKLKRLQFSRDFTSYIKKRPERELRCRLCRFVVVFVIVLVLVETPAPRRIFLVVVIHLNLCNISVISPMPYSIPIPPAAFCMRLYSFYFYYRK